MKNLLIILLFCSFLLPVNIHASYNNVDLNSYNQIEPKKDYLVWKYKEINGKTYKRLWNITKQRWETDRWIPA